MVKWNSSPHPLSDVRDWKDDGRLELRPDYQRREVWSREAKIMLIDTILRRIPMPKIFLANTIKDDRTYRTVIDGQQRIIAILEFLTGELVLDSPYEGPHKGKRFKDLDQDVRNEVLSYVLDFNEAVNPTDEETREVYSRVNKYLFPLNKQELRKADYPGAFLSMAEKISEWPFWEAIRIFSPAMLRRYLDVEYISELLAAMLGGIQDGKSTLDSFYLKYQQWGDVDSAPVYTLFERTCKELDALFHEEELPLAETRFRQKADFYSLHLATIEFVQAGTSISDLSAETLRQDLQLLDSHIAPESDIRICREYAIKCVSQANSGASRRWRYLFLRAVMQGTYLRKPPDINAAIVFYGVLDDVERLTSNADRICPSCNQPLAPTPDNKHLLLTWPEDSETFQMSNAEWVHVSCVANLANRIVAERPSDGADLS